MSLSDDFRKKFRSNGKWESPIFGATGSCAINRIINAHHIDTEKEWNFVYEWCLKYGTGALEFILTEKEEQTSPLVNILVGAPNVAISKVYNPVHNHYIYHFFVILDRGHNNVLMCA